MRFGSLFSGRGGIDLGLTWAGMQPAWMCERDKHCRGWLRSNWPGVPLYDDITTLDPAELAPVDLICGGFPCQPVSLAGRRQGANDARWLWPVMRDIVSCVRPAWVLGENTPGLITMGLDGVLSDLETIGYTCRTFVIPACAVNAPHRRDRVFVVAHSGGGGCDQGGAPVPGQAGRETFAGDGGQGAVADTHGTGPLPPARAGLHCGEESTRARDVEFERHGGHVADPASIGCEREGRPGHERSRGELLTRRGEGLPVGNPSVQGLPTPEQPGQPGQAEREQRTGSTTRQPGGAWSDAEWITGADGKARRVKPRLRLLAHGIPGRVAQLKALGNAVSPYVAYELGLAIMQAHNMNLPQRTSGLVGA